MGSATLKLDNRTYTMHTMPPMKGARFAAKVATLLGDAMKGMTTLGADEVADALFNVLGNVNPDKLMDLADEAMAFEVFKEEEK